MRTKSYNIAKLVTASALAVGLVAVAQSASAGIAITRHNMGNSNTTSNRTAGTNEVCVFCHTPHGANTSAAGAPLWNKLSTRTAASYTSYLQGVNSSTFDAITSGPGAVSLACLTCHDGTQAMDNMFNAAGAGGFYTNGGGTSGLSTGYTWSSGDQTGVSTDGFLISTGTFNAVVGTDLSNDHPIGMNYCASVLDTVTTISAASCNDIDFNSVTTANGKYWVDNGTAGSFQKTDFPLYANGTNKVKVECATCHDPHTGTNLFLRQSNTGSAVCIACHTK